MEYKMNYNDLTFECLYDLYVRQNLTQKEILLLLRRQGYKLSREKLANRIYELGIVKDIKSRLTNQILRTKEIAQERKLKVLKERPNWDYESLYNLYIVQNLSIRELESYCSVKRTVIGIRLKELGIIKDKDTVIKQNIERSQATLQQKYGESNPMKVDRFRKKQENTCINKYGVKNVSLAKEIQEKRYNTFKKRYGVKNVMQAPVFKEKLKQSMKEKYGVENIAQVSENRKIAIANGQKTLMERYGVTNPAQTQAFKDKWKDEEFCKNFAKKVHETKKKLGSYNKSKEEDLVYLKLREKYPDVLRQYIDSRYPFSCDFYIPSLDLFIEYQGHWRHGGHPFDENNSEDLKKLEKWKEKAKTSNYYSGMINTWTITDPYKRQVAKDNNLKFKEIFKRANIKNAKNSNLLKEFYNSFKI